MRQFSRNSRTIKRRNVKEKADLHAAEVEELNSRISLIKEKKITESNKCDLVSSLPILNSTKKSLMSCNIFKIAGFQRKSLIFSLCGWNLMVITPEGMCVMLSYIIVIVEILKKANTTKFSGISTIIVSPSENLGLKVLEIIQKLLKNTNITSCLVSSRFGNEYLEKIIPNTYIVIGTMFKIMNLSENVSTFHMNDCKIIVFDNIENDIHRDHMKNFKRIVIEIPDDTQKLYFATTISKQYERIVQIIFTDYKRLEIHESEVNIENDANNFEQNDSLLDYSYNEEESCFIEIIEDDTDIDYETEWNILIPRFRYPMRNI